MARNRWFRLAAVAVLAAAVAGAVVRIGANPASDVQRADAAADPPGEAVTSTEPQVGSDGDGAVTVETVARRALAKGSDETGDSGVDPQPATVAPDPGCGANDRPETGIQGDVPMADQRSGRAREGYNCGLALVGYSPLGARGGNANMAWAGHCAYIAGDGIAVVDVSDPTAPEQVGTLTAPGSLDSLETLHAVDAGDRSILVAGRYGWFLNFQLPVDSSPVDIYDVSDCANPKLLSSVDFPQSVHNLRLSADGRTVWGTLPLQAFDITDPRAPRYLGNLENQLRTQGLSAFALEYAHEAVPSSDGTRLYIGGQVVGDEATMILDIEHWPEQPARLVSRMTGPAHSIHPATIGGRRYLLRSDESIVNPTANGCLPDLTPFGGVAQPFLTDITNESAPVDRGRLTLDINDFSHCLDQLSSRVNASSHYHDVDDETDTTFAMVSMWNAGLRIFDVRDPNQPAEVAYFNPGMFDAPPLAEGGTPLDLMLGLQSSSGLDQAWGHVRYLPETGHIWVSTQTGGFWVLELEPQIRAALGLPALPARWPAGAPARSAAGSSIAPQVMASAEAVRYCMLALL